MPDWIKAPGTTPPRWRDVVVDPNAVERTPHYRAVGAEAFEDAVQRAIRAGARPPLEFVGAGMTGVVFCETAPAGLAFKVARYRDAGPMFLTEEAEWLRDAGRLQGVQRHVVRFVRYDDDNAVLVRECVKQREDWRRNETKLFNLHQRIGRLMAAIGWSAPEFKPDSYVYAPHRGPVLVDASMPHRLGRRAVQYVVDVLRGGRALPRSSHQTEEAAWRDLAFYVRREATADAIPRDLANRMIDRIADRAPSAREWLIA